MTDQEYDILDELYFVTSFSQLKRKIQLPDDQIKNILEAMYKRDWIRVLSGPDHEVPGSELDLEQYFHNYYYLATKKGLIAHYS
ncbi:MAG: hypothetical protein OEY56_10655 [Cyclobacteriaceae bacterium]|nr:hypothetical protein [Cyclobacteriaceae bacterium]